MTREEFKEWKKEPVTVEIDDLVRETEKAIIVEIGDDEYPVGKSIIGNLAELLDQLELGPKDRDEGLEITVPRWCAHENGWLDDEE